MGPSAAVEERRLKRAPPKRHGPRPADLSDVTASGAIARPFVGCHSCVTRNGQAPTEGGADL